MKNKKAEHKKELSVGTPKSGKPWKKFSIKATTEQKSVMKYQLRMQAKKRHQALKQKINQLRYEKIEKKKADKAMKRERQKLKEMKRLRSAQYQKIKDQSKIKKWPKKAKKLLVKLPPEIFYEKFA